MSETTNIPYTSTSTSTTIAGNEMVSLADKIKKYDTKELINFLRKEGDLKLDENDEEIIRKEKLTGRAFLKVTEEKLRSTGLGLGPASDLADFAKECKEKKLRSFSSYKTKADLEKVLQEDYIESLTHEKETQTELNYGERIEELEKKISEQAKRIKELEVNNSNKENEIRELNKQISQSQKKEESSNQVEPKKGSSEREYRGTCRKCHCREIDSYPASSMGWCEICFTDSL